MLLEQKLEKIHLTYPQKLVIDYIRNQKTDITHMTIEAIAEGSGTSTGTVALLARKLGYSDFNAFMEDYRQETEYLTSQSISIDPDIPFHEKDTVGTIANNIVTLKKEILDDTLQLLDYEELNKAVRVLKNCEHVFIFGISSSLLLGQIFRNSMLRIGKNVQICPDSQEAPAYVNLMQENDCAMFISYAGDYTDADTLLKKIHQKGNPVIGITGLGDSIIHTYADIQLHISTREKLYTKIGSFGSEESIKALLDILYAAYFAEDYQHNLDSLSTHTQNTDINRNSVSKLMKEL